MEQTVWLVEHNFNGESKWLRIHWDDERPAGYVSGWTKDPAQAIKFADELSAELYIRFHVRHAECEATPHSLHKLPRETEPIMCAAGTCQPAHEWKPPPSVQVGPTVWVTGVDAASGNDYTAKTGYLGNANGPGCDPDVRG